MFSSVLQLVTEKHPTTKTCVTYLKGSHPEQVEEKTRGMNSGSLRKWPQK